IVDLFRFREKALLLSAPSGERRAGAVGQLGLQLGHPKVARPQRIVLQIGFELLLEQAREPLVAGARAGVLVQPERARPAGGVCLGDGRRRLWSRGARTAADEQRSEQQPAYEPEPFHSRTLAK